MTKYYVGSSLKYHCVFEKAGDKKRKILLMLNCRRNAELIICIALVTVVAKKQLRSGLKVRLEPMNEKYRHMTVAYKECKEQ